MKPNIWRLQTQFDTQGLMLALQNSDPDIRRRAAAALRTLGAVEAIPTLKQVLESEAHPEGRAVLSSVLQELESEQVAAEEQATEESQVQRLVKQLRAADIEKALAAADELAGMGDMLAVEPLIVLFNDLNVATKVRLAAAKALIALDGAPAEVTLLAALSNHEWRIRRNAAAVLGRLKAAWAVEPLAAALKDSDIHVQRTAHAALIYIDTPEAHSLLEAAAPPPLEGAAHEHIDTLPKPAANTTTAASSTEVTEQSADSPKATAAPDTAKKATDDS